MIRITELALPLDYTPEALRAGRRQAPEDPRRGPARVHALQTQLRRAQEEHRHPLHLHRRRRRCADEAAVLKRFARDRQIGVAPGHVISPGCARRPRTLDGAARSSSASVRAGCSRRCCSRRWDSSPSCSSAAATCAGARRTPGRCGARRSLTPESNVQFGEGGAGLFSDGKLYSQIKDPKFYGRKVMHEFVRAGAPAEILLRQQAAHRHLPPHGHRREDARGDHRARRRGALREQGDRRADRQRPDRRRGARERRDAAQPARRARARPQLARHAAHARAARRLSRGQTFRDRLSHRTSAVADRSRALRPLRRSPGARRRRLQARASRQQWPLGLQLLHVSRAARSSRRLPSRGAWSPMA